MGNEKKPKIEEEKMKKLRDNLKEEIVKEIMKKISPWEKNLKIIKKLILGKEIEEDKIIESKKIKKCKRKECKRYTNPKCTGDLCKDHCTTENNECKVKGHISGS